MLKDALYYNPDTKIRLLAEVKGISESTFNTESRRIVKEHGGLAHVSRQMFLRDPWLTPGKKYTDPIMPLILCKLNTRYVFN